MHECGFLHQRIAVAIISVAVSEVAIMSMVVGIAQLAEHRTVAPTVAGSIPVSHPRFSFRRASSFLEFFLYVTAYRLLGTAALGCPVERSSTFVRQF
jgi:hypothetical protein